MEKIREATQRRVEGERAWREGVAERTRQKLGETVAAEELPAGDAIAMVVPSFARGVVRLPEERVARFRETLEEAMSRAVGMVGEEGRAAMIRETYAYRGESDRLVLPVINACTTCRGACCPQGREHAFLVAEFLAWRLLEEPGLTPEAMVADYLARIPAETCEDSCVYHGPRGCVLPREIRGPTCNDFVCSGIVDRRGEMACDPGVPSVAVACEGETVVRVGYVSREGQRREWAVGEGVGEASEPTVQPCDGQESR